MCFFFNLILLRYLFDVYFKNHLDGGTTLFEAHRPKWSYYREQCYIYMFICKFVIEISGKHMQTCIDSFFITLIHVNPKFGGISV